MFGEMFLLFDRHGICALNNTGVAIDLAKGAKY